MNPDDYDEDGNNIVPCPICLNVYCPSKEDTCHDCGRKLDGENCSAGGVHNKHPKCPEEDEFVKSLEKPLPTFNE